MSNILPGYGALGQQLQADAATIGLPPQPRLGQPDVRAVTLNSMLPSESAPTVPFEAALPGSTIAVFAQGFEYGERCRVIKLDPEYPPNAVPALHLISDVTGERKLLISTMQGARIQILVSAEQLGIERVPEGAIRARVKPIDVAALQWKGGAAEASKFILWAQKYASVRYEEETEASDEFMVIEQLDQQAEGYMHPGDYLVKNPDGEFRVVPAGEFSVLYEEVSLVD